ncbi:MAG: D-aminoacylase, partial [Halieaceae bacterium]|nr:D-aminoacylase [Halieaceae bacterium]
MSREKTQLLGQYLRPLSRLAASFALAFLAGCDADNSPQPEVDYDTLIIGGTVYDGSGEPGRRADLAIIDDRIAAIGDLSDATADHVIDATGKAVSPGFINMIGWGVTTLNQDGRGLSDVTQGITLEVFGEGQSMGPLSPAMKAEFPTYWNGVEAEWTTLGEYLEFLEQKGVSPNIASFIGAATPRIHVLGRDDVAPNPEQLAAMQELVREAMREGA